jgi:adenylate kinase
MVESKKQKAIMILGAPGSGKGTQAELLTDKFSFFKLETSALVGSAIDHAAKGEFITIEGKKYLFSEQAAIRRRGDIWDGRFTTYFTGQKLKELAREKKSVVLSGSPRNLEDAKRTVPVLKKFYGPKNVVMLVLKISPRETMRRNKYRKECTLAGHSILHNKETFRLTKCPLDGSKLIRRKDDNPKAIRLRLEQYQEKTFPVFAYLRKHGITVKEINGEQPVAAVFQDVLKALKLRLN